MATTRITLRLDSKLHAVVQKHARDNGRSLNAEINQACKEHVMLQVKKNAGPR